MGASLDDADPQGAQRVRSLMRSWLTARLKRIACTTVVMGLMIRDVLHECTTIDLEQPAERHAQRRAAAIQQSLEQFLERVHRHDHYSSQSMLLHQALLQAVQIDEMDYDQVPMEDAEPQRRELEEVVFRTNNAVRSFLQVDTAERGRRVRLITEALQSQLGLESRHLRRLGIGVHGLQMMGDSPGDLERRDDDEKWLPVLVDELMMLAAQEDQGISDERPWSQEPIALRRWLAEDWLRPDDATDSPSSGSTSQCR